MTARVAPQPARRLNVPVRARSGDAATTFLQAVQAVMGTRDPQKARQQLAAAKAAFDQLKQADGDMTEYQKQLDAATERTAALPILYGAPAVPRPQVSRNPDASTKAATHEQQSQAQAWMNGYGAGVAPAGLKGWLSKYFSFLAPAAAKTPAYDALPAAQKTQFLAIAKKADAAGQVALHDMLTSGKLSAGLLQELNGLATDRLDGGVDQTALLSEALVELKDPVTISQQSRGTCAATSVQILTALDAPEQYVRMLRGLASPQGTAKLPSGDVLKREPDWNVNNDGGRSLPSRLLQPAFMEFANGDLDYNNQDDMDLDPKTGERAPSGLTAEQALGLLNASKLSPNGFDVQGLVYDPNLPEATGKGLDASIESARDMLMVLQNGKAIDPKSQDELLAALKKQASPQNPVYATVIYTLYPEAGNVGFHAILVTGVKDGFVSYINPWGQEEKLSEKDFKGSVLSADVRK